MENQEITYEDRIGGLLLSLREDEVFVIASNVKPENRDRFTSVVKSYIDRNIGNRDGWEIIFSGDYKQIKKTRYICNK